MMFIERLCLVVDDVGAVVEGWVRVGGSAVAAGAVGGTVVGDAQRDELFHGFAAQLVEGAGGQEIASLGLVDDGSGHEGGVAQLAELFDDRIA